MAKNINDTAIKAGFMSVRQEMEKKSGKREKKIMGQRNVTFGTPGLQQL